MSKLEKANNYIAGTGEDLRSYKTVNRATYIDDTIYSYSQFSSEICSFDKTTAEKLNSIVLE